MNHFKFTNFVNFSFGMVLCSNNNRLKYTMKHTKALKRDQFDKASQLFEKKQDLLNQFREKEIHEEEERQFQEKKQISNALTKMKDETLNSWEAQWNRFLNWKSEKLHQLELKHDNQINQFELETIPCIKSQRIRYSVQVQDWSRSKEKLKQMRQYQECEGLTRNIDRKKAEEEEKFNFNLNQIAEKRRNRLISKQEEERSLLLAKLKVLEQKLHLQKTMGIKTLEQKFSNLLSDADHAFRMEFISQREVNGPVKSRKSLEKTSATFMGTHLQRKLRRGEQYVVPSLCEMYADDLED